MAKIAGLSQQFFYAGRDLSGDVGSIEEASAIQEVLDVTGLNAASVERVAGRVDGRLVWRHFFNDASGLSHSVVSTLPTANVLVLWTVVAAIGSAAFAMTAKQASARYERGEDMSLVGTVTCEGQGNPMEDCEMLTAGLRSDTSATNGSSFDNGAASSNGIVGHIHCSAFSGTSVVVKIEESSDNGSSDAFTAKATFATINGANASERITATGSVERYLRVATSGTFSSAKIAVAARRGTAQDADAIS